MMNFAIWISSGDIRKLRKILYRKFCSVCLPKVSLVYVDLFNWEYSIVFANNFLLIQFQYSFNNFCQNLVDHTSPFLNSGPMTFFRLSWGSCFSVDIRDESVQRICESMSLLLLSSCYYLVYFGEYIAIFAMFYCSLIDGGADCSTGRMYGALFMRSETHISPHNVEFVIVPMMCFWNPSCSSKGISRPA